MRSDPGAQLSTQLARTRRRYIFGRLFHVLTLALAADLGLDLINFCVFSLFNWALPMPFFFEIVLAALILRELPGMKRELFAHHLDRQFSLKDRLYSFTEYGRRKDISGSLRQAQSRETLAAVDFKIIRRNLSSGPPPAMVLLLPTAFFMAWLSWNASYTPPGITNRLANRIAPDLVRMDKQQSSLESSQPGPAPGQPAAGGTSLAPAPPEAEKLSSDQEAPAWTRDDPAGRAFEELTDPENLNEGGPDGGEGSSADDTAPEILQSVPETLEVSAPVPPTLAKEAAGGFRSFPEARSFLNLIPGQRGKELTDLDRNIIGNFRKQMEKMPERYHDHLNRYYEELENDSQ
jgi:hypothetical protein